MQMAVRPKPTEAMLAASPMSLVRTLQRSLIRPVAGFACSQKNRKFACSRSFRNWSSSGEIGLGIGGGVDGAAGGAAAGFAELLAGAGGAGACAWAWRS